MFYLEKIEIRKYFLLIINIKISICAINLEMHLDFLIYDIRLENLNAPKNLLYMQNSFINEIIILNKSKIIRKISLVMNI